MLLKGKVKNVFEWYTKQARELENKASRDPEKLLYYEAWKLAYYKQPYLLLESDDLISERFSDIFTNCFDLSAEGKITPTPMVDNNARLSKLFTEIIEEVNWRGIYPGPSIQTGFQQIRAYFENGMPLGAKMFRNLPATQQDCLFKFSKKEYIKEMYEHGRFRISPASFYSKGSHLRAIKDLETERHYRIKAINEVIGGLDTIEIDGHTVDLTNGVIPIDLMVSDYYLFSSCTKLSRRMPTDFEADAVLIIKNRTEFIRRLRFKLLDICTESEFLEGDVYYYDPYHDHPKDMNQEFYKNISFAYQKEHRCIVRPQTNKSLSPFFIELGKLDDIADVIYTS